MIGLLGERSHGAPMLPPLPQCCNGGSPEHPGGPPFDGIEAMRQTNRDAERFLASLDGSV
jgi:hypothetical protein